MLSLILVIVLASAFNLMMKHAHARNYSVLAVGCVNYVVAGIVSAVWVCARPGSHSVLSPEAVLFGCLGGAMYVACYLFIMVMLDRQGIAVATAMTRLAIAVPILVAIAVWDERPGLLRTVGLLVTFAAILLFDNRASSAKLAGGLWHHAWPLAGCFLTAGASRLSQKAFSQLCDQAERPLYLATWFGFAGLLAIMLFIARRELPSARDMWFGSVLGGVNILSLFFTITALREVEATVFFPVTSAAGLVIVVALAACLWREPLDTRTCWGIALACCALVLVNLPF